MEIIKTLAIFLVGLFFGFGFWYLIFWFISAETNLFAWHWVTKIVYLMFSFSSSTGVINALLKEY